MLFSEVMQFSVSIILEITFFISPADSQKISTFFLYFRYKCLSFKELMWFCSNLEILIMVVASFMRNAWSLKPRLHRIIYNTTVVHVFMSLLNGGI